MTNNNYKDKVKLGDYPTFCDTCGNKCWYSQTKVLGKYTGLGGALVCPECVDGIVGSFVPIKIEPDKTPKIVRDSLNSASLEDAQELNYNTFPPSVSE